jgi:inosine-uridine preferring nucleoside hydrolase
MHRFLVDADTAAADAVALVMALRHPGVRVEAITIVAGNVPVDARARVGLPREWGSAESGAPPKEEAPLRRAVYGRRNEGTREARREETA